ncbi:MAG: hypothetical protein ACXWKC_16880 [Xanthobacteraceae bacterium]
MKTFKYTAGQTIARFRAWSAGIRGGRDMARRYYLLSRLTKFGPIRRRFIRHEFPRAALV